MKKLSEQMNESLNNNVNEGLGTIALGIVGGLIGYKVIKKLAKMGMDTVKVKKAERTIDSAQGEMAKLLAKYPKSCKGDLLKRVMDGDKELFAGSGNSNELQNVLDMKDWEQEDREKFIDLYIGSSKAWKEVFN